jgi:hypothetical protein
MSDTSPKDAVKAVAKLTILRTAGFDLHLIATSEGKKLPAGEYMLVLESALSQVRKQALLEAAEIVRIEGCIQGPEGVANAIRKLAEE